MRKIFCHVDSAKRPTFHWAKLSGIDRINKATALYHSRGINHQNRVRVCRYSYWFFWKKFWKVWCPKIQRHVLRRRPLQGINFEKRKSPTRFWWLMPREWYNAVALLMRSSLIPDKFAQWNVGHCALLGRARLMIKTNWGKTIFIK